MVVVDEELARVEESPVIPEAESYVSGKMQSWATRDVANKKAELADEELDKSKILVSSKDKEIQDKDKRLELLDKIERDREPTTEKLSADTKRVHGKFKVALDQRQKIMSICNELHELRDRSSALSIELTTEREKKEHDKTLCMIICVIVCVGFTIWKSKEYCDL